jgi:hypothetical protein
VRASLGLSAQALAGAVSDKIRAADAIATANGGAPTNDVTYARGAMALAALSPAIAPHVGARVGLGQQFEGGVTYTGRGARIDARRGFGTGAYAASIGVGLDGTFAGGSSATKLPGIDIGSLRGFGFDIPALVGWRSTSSLYQVWGGARGGWERYFISPVVTEPTNIPPTLEADRIRLAGVVGFATGFGRVHVGLEIEIGYQLVTGKLGTTSTSVDGVAFTPASAVWWDF